MSILSQEQVALLTDYDANSKYSQAYQTLYVNIRFNWDSEWVKQQTILLATPVAYAGQAAAVANVAIAAAQSGTPVVIVDADLHAPSLHQRFGVGKTTGLSDLLTTPTITPQAIASQLQTTFVPGLRLLCAGTAPSPSANVLLSAKLQDVVECLRQALAEMECKPGMIIFHSSPVLASTDASVIAAFVEQTFLTIVTGRTTRSQAKQAQEQLQRAHAKLAGVILLDV